MSFYWFTITLTGAKPGKKILIPLVIFYVAMMALIPTSFILHGVQSLWYGKAPLIGPLFPFYVLCVYFPIAMGVVALVKNYHISKNNDERTRNQYIVAGAIAMFIGEITDYLPALGLSIYPLGIIGNILFCILATIAMLKYGLRESGGPPQRCGLFSYQHTESSASSAAWYCFLLLFFKISWRRSSFYDHHHYGYFSYCRYFPAPFNEITACSG